MLRLQLLKRNYASWTCSRPGAGFHFQGHRHQDRNESRWSGKISNTTRSRVNRSEVGHEAPWKKNERNILKTTRPRVNWSEDGHEALWKKKERKIIKAARPKVNRSEDGHETPGKKKATSQARASPDGLSIIEQLFPERSNAVYSSNTELEVSPLPLPFDITEDQVPLRQEEKARVSAYQRRIEADMTASGHQTTVLVLRGACKNLNIEDFRRLIPQGKHIEGWTLELGDIEAVVPGRDLETLAQDSTYFVLFSSAMSAFTYQGHVSRLHQMISAYTPTSLHSPLPPAPGQLMEGIDVQSAMDAFSLTAPQAPLQLRQLKPPLARWVADIAQHKGYPAIVHRPGKSAFEVRLTFDGNSCSIAKLRDILTASGTERDLYWSGTASATMQITRWGAPVDETGQTNDPPGRGPVVYIIGFETEGAAQSFVQHWHRRPLSKPKKDPARSPDELEEHLPPIANVEMLW